MTNLSKNKLRSFAYLGAFTLVSPLIAQEIPKEATPEAIIEAAAKAAVEAEAQKDSTPPMDPAQVKESMSYGLGFQNGEQFGAYGFVAEDFDKEAYIAGLIASLSGEDFGRNDQTYEKAMSAFQKIVTEREIALAKANEATEKKFLVENGKREGVVTTKSNLQYEILTKGTGKTYTPPAALGENPQAIDTTTNFLLHCTGKLLDGTVVMKTPVGEPFPFDLNVLPGIAEALQIMPVGSKWKLFIPSSLAFGAQRQGPKIAPSSMLVYEVELTDIQTKPAPQLQGIPHPIIPQ